MQPSMPTPLIDFAQPFQFGAGAFGSGKALLIALALAVIAAQPPYAIMVWRTVRRALRDIVKGRTGDAASGRRHFTTLDAALVLAGGGMAVAIAVRPAMPVPVAGALGAVLLVLALLDFRYFWLPDRLTLPLGVIGVAAAAPDIDLLTEGIVAAALAGGAFYALHAGYRMLRGVDGLGLGDVKLVASLGAWVGLAALPWLVLTAALTALGVAALSALLAGAGRDGAGPLAGQARSPFGLHLALAGWVFVCLRQSAFALQ